jgi:hypothetical protein
VIRVSGWSWAWITWFGAFCVIEGFALGAKETPEHPATLSAQVWWLVRGVGMWHRIARVVLVCGLAWLSVHLATGWV